MSCDCPKGCTCQVYAETGDCPHIHNPPPSAGFTVVCCALAALLSAAAGTVVTFVITGTPQYVWATVGLCVVALFPLAVILDHLPPPEEEEL